MTAESPAYGGTLTFAVVLLFVFLLMMTFHLVGTRSLRMARRYMRVSLEQAQGADERRPVLFLRSFQDDTVALPALMNPLI